MYHEVSHHILEYISVLAITNLGLHDLVLAVDGRHVVRRRRRRRCSPAPVIYAASHFDHKKSASWVPISSEESWFGQPKYSTP